MRRYRSLLAAGAVLVLSACVHQPYAVPASVAADTDYLVQLGLMRGHLLVGHTLLALGERPAAQSHAKHPSDELYRGVESSFAERGATGFATELDAHARAVASGDQAATEKTYAAVTAAIGRSEEVVYAGPSLTARVIVALLREAAREYAVGIVDGQLENAHEYQDAYGFTNVALNMARKRHAAMAATDGDRQVFEQIAQRIAELREMWPSLVPPDTLQQSQHLVRRVVVGGGAHHHVLVQDATRLHAAADDVARLALKLRPASRF